MSKPGNKNGTKLKEPKVRQLAYKQYCAHIASGLPKEAFFFSHPKHSVSWETMDRYIAENPSEFPPIKMQEAKAKRYSAWLAEGQMLMRGKYKSGSPVVWQTIMRNIFKEYGWDKQEQSGAAELVMGLENALGYFKEVQEERKEAKKCPPSSAQ